LNEKLRKLAEEIKREIEQVEHSIERATLGWQRYQEREDELYLDSVALGLHHFYSGLERVFEKVARMIDASVPQGVNWHQQLLEQMSQEIAGQRPAFISSSTKEALEEYRGLRHVVRNVYGFELKADKLKPLVESVPSVFKEVSSEAIAFANFLTHQASS
jgi:hypothetical protein